MADSTDSNRVLLTGENPFIRLNAEGPDGEATTNASFWRILFCPAGPGCVLFLKSELTGGDWCVYSDNIAMARWLQRTVQGTLNAELGDTSIPVVESTFAAPINQLPHFWQETITTEGETIAMTWAEIGEPVLLHGQPGDSYAYGVASTLIPAGEARLTINGVQAAGKTWATDRNGRPFGTSCLAFSESWTEPFEGLPDSKL